MVVLRWSLDPIAQSVARLIADPGVVSSIPARSHTFMEIDHEIFHSPPSTDSSVTSESMFTKYRLTRLVKLAQEKVWLVN